MIFIVIYIYSYVYLCIYTPSYQLFKSFSVSKFNSEISFLYQLFKDNSNFILKKSCKVICLLFMMSLFFTFIYTYIYMHLQIWRPSRPNFPKLFIYFLTPKIWTKTSANLFSCPLSITRAIRTYWQDCMYVCMYVWKKKLTRWLSTDVFHSWSLQYAFDPERPVP